MDDKVKGLQLLTETILKNLTHPDYKRVTDLATEYFDIFTGANLAKYLQRIVRREDEAMFKQRMEIFQSAIPSTVDNLDQTFNKPLRSNRIYSSIDLPSVDGRNEIVDRMQQFYQGESESGVDAYLAERWKMLNFYDPNAFIGVEFADFNADTSKAYPFPVEYTSKEAIRYAYKNGTLDWLMVKQAIKYRTDQANIEATADGAKYILYLENSAIVLIQVDKDKRITDIPNPIFVEIKSKQNTVTAVYVRQDFDTKSNGIPYFRAGYKVDPQTNGRTCLSVIHAAMPFFKKELKTGSEFDITMSMHAFPIRIMYGRACEGDKQNGKMCVNGKTPEGKKCGICKGEGTIPIATSAQDIVYVKPPKGKDDPVLDLEKAFIYKTPPADFLTFMDEYIDKLTERAKSAVFADQAVQKKQVTQTATEMDYSYDNVYDTFYSYGQKYSYAWKFIVRQIAVYTDNYSDKLSLYHQFPKDFKMKGIEVLLNEAKLAADSGLSQHAINAINNDVLDQLYSDDPDTLAKIRIKDKFHPFSGKSSGEIQALLISGDITPYYKTLYTYFDVIFDIIDNTIGDKFYISSYEYQKAEIKKQVDLLNAEIDQNKAKPFNNNPLNPGTNGQ